MDGRTWFGVDLGTQSVRALAVGDDGTVHAAATRSLRSLHPASPDGDVRHEQDPGDWTRAVDAALAEVASGGDRRASVVSRWTARGHGRPDQRRRHTTDTGCHVRRRPRRPARGAGPRGGCGGLGPPRLPGRRHLGAAHRARALADHPGAHVRHQTDVVTAHLVGHDVPTDTSTALKTGYDLLADRWPADVLAELGVDPGALPAVCPSGRTLGGLGDTVAAATGLRPGTPVLAGTTDGCAAQFGAGAVRPGDWNAVLGTTLVLKGVADRLLHDPAGTVYCHRDPRRVVAARRRLEHRCRRARPARRPVAVRRPHRGPGRRGARRPARGLPPRGHGRALPVRRARRRGLLARRRPRRPLAELVAERGERTAFAALTEGVAFVERLCFEHVAGLGADVSGPRHHRRGHPQPLVEPAPRRRPWRGAARPDQAEPALGAAMLARAGVAAGDADPDLVAAAGEMVHVAEVLAPRHDPVIDERYAAFRAALTERGWIGPPREDT